jgi:hypothetical protein
MGHQRTISGERYVVDIASGPGLFDPATFDELLPAAEYIFEGLTNRHRRFGFGISLIGFRPNTLEQPADHSFPKAGLSRAVTGLVLFETPGPGEVQERVVHMCFYDALQGETIEINGGSRPAGG